MSNVSRNQAITMPSRHPHTPRSVPLSIDILAHGLAIRPPSPRRWQRIGEALLEGDEPMHQLLEWMRSEGAAKTRPMFNQIVGHGIVSVPDAPQPFHDFFDVYETIPDWVDTRKLRRGQRAMRRLGADGMYIARDVSFLGGYQFASFNQTLLRTGVLKKGSNKRFAETMEWGMNVTRKGGLDHLGIGYQSTIRVRMIHEYVRRQVSAMPDWREDEWGLPVNQTDMAVTMLGALIAPATAAVGIGLVLTPQELEGIAHVSRYVGWLMGVDDEWLPRSFRDGVRILYHLMSALSEPDETTKQLAVPMSDDPLEWHYDSFAPIRRRIARAQHKSITGGFLGPSTMKKLGLSPLALPWYQALRIPVNLSRSAAAVLVPGGMSRAADRGFREQENMMRTMMGTESTEIGASARVLHTTER